MSKLTHIMDIKGQKGLSTRKGYAKKFDCTFEPPGVATTVSHGAKGNLTKSQAQDVYVRFRANASDIYNFTLGKQSQLEKITLYRLEKPQGTTTDQPVLTVTLDGCRFHSARQGVEDGGTAIVEAYINYDKAKIEEILFNNKGKQTSKKVFSFNRIEDEVNA